MKAITAVLAVVCLGALAQDVSKDQEHINAMRADGTITNVVKAMIASGEVCNVSGHVWRDGRPGETATFGFADNRPGTYYRTCSLCKSSQTKREEWK